MKVKAYIHSKKVEEQNTEEEVELVKDNGNNDYEVITADGIRCHAIFNAFNCHYYADDKYRIIKDEEKK